jgi:hypothetical protein
MSHSAEDGKAPIAQHASNAAMACSTHGVQLSPCPRFIVRTVAQPYTSVCRDRLDPLAQRNRYIHLVGALPAAPVDSHGWDMYALQWVLNNSVLPYE